MRVVGADPGIAKFGWAVLDFDGGPVLVEAGSVTTAPRMGTPARLLAIKETLKKVFEKYQPDMAAVEEVFYSGKNSISVAYAKAVFLLICAENEVPVFELSPTMVKSTVSGWGFSDKEGMMLSLKRLFGIEVESIDAADAAAIAITAWLNRRGVEV